MHLLSALFFLFAVVILPALSLTCCKCFKKKSEQPQMQNIPAISPMSAATVPENNTPEQIIKSADQVTPNVVSTPLASLPNVVDQVKSNKHRPTSVQLAPVVIATSMDKIPDKLKTETKAQIEENKDGEKKLELVSNKTVELFMSSTAIRRQREASVKKKIGSGFYATESQADDDDTLEEYPDPEQEKTEDNPQSKSKKLSAKKTRHTELGDLKTAETK